MIFFSSFKFKFLCIVQMKMMFCYDKNIFEVLKNKKMRTNTLHSKSTVASAISITPWIILALMFIPILTSDFHPYSAVTRKTKPCRVV